MQKRGSLFLIVLAISFAAHAQDVEVKADVIEKQEAGSQKIAQPIRLSDYLIGRQPSQKDYLLGMNWKSNSELESQKRLQEELLLSLSKLSPPKNDPSFESSRQALRAMIEKMPITGRVSLPNTNARYLQVNPKIDPILDVGDQVQIPKVPSTITLIRTDGLLCKVAFQSNVETRQYFRSCRPQAVVADWAWVVEPDGKVRKVATATWNEAKQDYPAPGSWIWAPPQGSVWASTQAQQFNKLFVKFLSTQESSGQVQVKEQEATIDQGVIERSQPVMSNAERFYSSRNLPITRNIYGVEGLLETPSARMAPAGTGSIGMSLDKPYGQINVFLTPLDFLEFGFRYTNINNIPYAVGQTSQTYKDKSADLKLKLIEESHYVPEIGLGFQDFLGNGLFSGEYLVGSKRFDNFDYSLGLGWGYLGNRNNVNNPFKVLGPSYETRPPFNNNSQGGNFTGDYFKGPSAIFGGVQYHTPWDPLILKAEIDGNNYQHEPFANNQLSKTPINIGAVYHWGFADFTVALRQGTQVMFSVNFQDRMDQWSAPKVAEKAPVSVNLRPVGAYTPPTYLSLSTSDSGNSLNKTSVATAPSVGKNAPVLKDYLEQKTDPNYQINQANLANSELDLQPSEKTISISAAAIRQEAQSKVESGAANISVPATQIMLDFQEQTGWDVTSLKAQGNSWIISLDNATGVYLSERINKGIGILHRDAPTNITEFTLQFYNWGMLISSFKVDRTQWMLSQTQLLPPSKKQASISPTPIEIGGNQQGQTLGELSHKPFQGGVGLGYTQILGGPDTPLLFALSAQGEGVYKFSEDAWLSGLLNLRLVDNFGKFQYTQNSNLPPVRTDIRQYMTTSVATMPNLQMTKTFQFDSNQFASLYGGYLEMMFAGVGGEYLYRPVNSKLAVGVDINRVQQRQFNQWTSLQDYRVTTGNVTTYWDTGYENMLVKLSLGQYLAGDRGGTIDVSRAFDNGVKIGAYVTRTNASYAQYGEGSYDKGIYVSVPFDAFFGVHSSSAANLLWTPLIRDGGAKLSRQYPLYDLTNSRDNRALTTGPAPQPLLSGE